jgi:hypothetical protein
MPVQYTVQIGCTAASPGRNGAPWEAARAGAEASLHSPIPISCGCSVVRRPGLLRMMVRAQLRRVIFAQGQRVTAAAKVARASRRSFTAARCS